MYICIYVYMYICIDVYMYICIYVDLLLVALIIIVQFFKAMFFRGRCLVPSGD